MGKVSTPRCTALGPLAPRLVAHLPPWIRHLNFRSSHTLEVALTPHMWLPSPLTCGKLNVVKCSIPGHLVWEQQRLPALLSPHLMPSANRHSKDAITTTTISQVLT